MKCKECDSTNVRETKSVLLCFDCAHSEVLKDNGGKCCPECKTKLEIKEGCSSCPNCSWAACSK